MLNPWAEEKVPNARTVPPEVVRCCSSLKDLLKFESGIALCRIARIKFAGIKISTIRLRYKKYSSV
jgi:hypothetical protein